MLLGSECESFRISEIGDAKTPSLTPFFSGTSRPPGKSLKKSMNLAKSSYFTSLDFPSQRATFWGAQVGSWPSRGTGPGGVMYVFPWGVYAFTKGPYDFKKTSGFQALRKPIPTNQKPFPWAYEHDLELPLTPIPWKGPQKPRNQNLPNFFTQLTAKKTGVESSKMLWGVDMTTQPRDPQRTLPILGVDSVSCMKCSAPKKNNHQVLPSDPFGSFFLWPFQGWLVTSIWGIKGSLLSLLSSQLMVTCCFGACWFGILISPKMEGIGIFRGTMIESQTTGPQTNNCITRKTKRKKRKTSIF